ncbi:MAG: sigma-70 family RNA polymerase sigma factor [Bacteroidaceae bacterium]|nr:sigma-70 family RNA polymerase sigma factor [Bacteroidaceae bacterium]
MKKENLEKYLPLVEKVADEYQNQGLTLEELIEAGKDGLKKAEERYNPKADFSFESYAVWWVRQRIIQAIEEKKK